MQRKPKFDAFAPEDQALNQKREKSLAKQTIRLLHEIVHVAFRARAEKIRQEDKIASFGTAYGMTTQKLADLPGKALTIKDIKILQEKMFKANSPLNYHYVDALAYSMEKSLYSLPKKPISKGFRKKLNEAIDESVDKTLKQIVKEQTESLISGIGDWKI